MIANLNELQEQIRSRYDGLSKRLQQVARYLLDNTNSVVFNTVAVIAKEADVPPSTLIRFANAFNFRGFNEMQQLFRLNLLEETTSYTNRAKLFRQLNSEVILRDQPSQILKEFAQTNTEALQKLAATTPSNDLLKAVDLLAQAERIYIIGLRRSFSIASYFNYALSQLECRPYLIDGLGGMFKEQISQVTDKDLLIAISFSPYAEETIMISEKVANVGANQIIITDSQISPFNKLSQLCFIVQEAEVNTFRSQSASLCLVQSLIIALACRLGNDFPLEQ